MNRFVVENVNKFLAETFAVTLPCGVWLSLNNLLIKQNGKS